MLLFNPAVWAAIFNFLVFFVKYCILWPIAISIAIIIWIVQLIILLIKNRQEIKNIGTPSIEKTFGRPLFTANVNYIDETPYENNSDEV